jgi:serine/threonine-protein phosphatase 4 catalytic subunit
MEGYRWMFDRRLLTIWSAPNYCHEQGNLGAVMRYDGALGADSEVVVFAERKVEKA